MTFCSVHLLSSPTDCRDLVAIAIAIISARMDPQLEGKQAYTAEESSDASVRNGNQEGANGTLHDARDMARLGKKQQFQVRRVEQTSPWAHGALAEC